MWHISQDVVRSKTEAEVYTLTKLIVFLLWDSTGNHTHLKNGIVSPDFIPEVKILVDVMKLVITLLILVTFNFSTNWNLYSATGLQPRFITCCELIFIMIIFIVIVVVAAVVVDVNIIIAPRF